MISRALNPGRLIYLNIFVRRRASARVRRIGHCWMCIRSGEVSSAMASRATTQTTHDDTTTSGTSTGQKRNGESISLAVLVVAVAVIQNWTNSCIDHPVSADAEKVLAAFFLSRRSLTRASASASLFSHAIKRHWSLSLNLTVSFACERTWNALAKWMAIANQHLNANHLNLSAGIQLAEIVGTRTRPPACRHVHTIRARLKITFTDSAWSTWVSVGS